MFLSGKLYYPNPQFQSDEDEGIISSNIHNHQCPIPGLRFIPLRQIEMVAMYAVTSTWNMHSQRHERSGSCRKKVIESSEHDGMFRALSSTRPSRADGNDSFAYRRVEQTHTESQAVTASSQLEIHSSVSGDSTDIMAM